MLKKTKKLRNKMKSLTKGSLLSSYFFPLGQKLLFLETSILTLIEKHNLVVSCIPPYEHSFQFECLSLLLI
jgi:hypothetical protein